MFEDITTKDITLNEEDRKAGYALLCKYLVNNINSINDGNINDMIRLWFRHIVDTDDVDEEQVKEFKEELRSYIPNALH